MSSWIFPNNPIQYEIKDDFDSINRVHWHLNLKNIKTGDIVYIYRSNTIKAIKWKCIVKNVNYYLRENDDFTYSPIQTEEFCDGPCVEIIPIKELDDPRLNYHELIKHGLKGAIQNQRSVVGELLDYIESVVEDSNPQYQDDDYINHLTLSELQTIVDHLPTSTVKTSVVSTKQYHRNPIVAQYAKVRANGYCQLCGKKAPFKDKQGNPYLESHHIIWLSRGGSDDIHNVVALCCNCHKKMHIVDDPKDVAILESKVK